MGQRTTVAEEGLFLATQNAYAASGTREHLPGEIGAVGRIAHRARRHDFNADRTQLVG